MPGGLSCAQRSDLASVAPRAFPPPAPYLLPPTALPSYPPTVLQLADDNIYGMLEELEAEGDKKSGRRRKSGGGKKKKKSGRPGAAPGAGGA